MGALGTVKYLYVNAIARGSSPLTISGREMSRYQMMNDVEKSFDFSHGVSHYELNIGQEGYIMSHDKEVCLTETSDKRAWGPLKGSTYLL
jgi:hypothetical protein